MPLSKNTIKYISSLHQKKYRQQYHQFIVEGDKIARELILEKELVVHSVYALPNWIEEQNHLLFKNDIEFYPVTEKELSRISALKTPNQVLVLCDQRNDDWQDWDLNGQLILFLDGIQDPGNFGTILRTADWFGINYVLSSPDTVELYNPKVLQATMGAFLRIKSAQTELSAFLELFPDLPVYGTTVSGNNIYEYSLSSSGIIVVGNESKGISKQILDLVEHELTIPSWQNRKMESLNAAVATAIVLSVFRQV